MRPTTTRGCGAPAAPAKTATASGRQPASARRRKNAGRAFMNARILSRSSGTRAPGARRNLAITAGVRLRPLEGLNLLTLAILSGLTLWLDGRVPDSGGILTRYALMAAGLAVVLAAVRRETRLAPVLPFAVNFYPIAFLL